MSDVHLEFFTSSSPKNAPVLLSYAPILLLAGDIGNPFEPRYATFLACCSALFEKVFVICGNHEYYQKTHTMKETETQIASVVAAFPKVTFLGSGHKPYEDYQGIRWIGTTLWSRIRKPQFTINDTKMIPDFRATTDVVNQLHDQCREDLQRSLQTATTPCVVMTHHIPSFDLILPRFRDPFYANYNQWFATDDCDDLIQQHSSKIIAWVYGHTHEPSTQTHYGIPFLCNPLGYPDERKITEKSCASVFHPLSPSTST